ncbi:MAG: hypothetical protein ACO1OG_06750 [Devosia sp.]
MMHGALMGLVAGYAATTDAMTAPVFAIMCMMLFAFALRDDRGAAVKLAIGGILGAAIGLAPLLVYNATIFGNPFTLGYSHVVGFEGMDEGLFGISWPNPQVAWEVLFGLYRGILPLSPIIVVGLAGLIAMLRQPDLRPFGALGLAGCAIYLLLNAGYFYWDGGFSTGPRHLVPALAFIGMGLAFGWPASRPLRWLAIALLVASLALSFIAASAGMYAPYEFDNPIVEFLLPALPEGRVLRDLSGMLMAWVIMAILLVAAGRADRSS